MTIFYFLIVVTVQFTSTSFTGAEDNPDFMGVCVIAVITGSGSGVVTLDDVVVP